MSTGPAPTPVTESLVRKWFGPGWHLVRGYFPLDKLVPGGGHDGWDIGAPRGTPVYALAAGTVNYARDARTDPNPKANWALGGGNVVNIDVEKGKTRFQYAHLDTILVKPGQVVQKGQQIGTVGSSGFTFGQTHLHFGIWDLASNKMIDPQPFFEGTYTPGGAGATKYTADQWNALIDCAMSSGTFIKGLIGPGNESAITGCATKLHMDLSGVHLTDYHGKTLSDLRDALAGQGTIPPADLGVPNPLDALGTLAGAALWLTKAEHWLGIFALIGGALIVWKGAEFTMKGTAPRVAAPVPPVG